MPTPQAGQNRAFQEQSYDTSAERNEQDAEELENPDRDRIRSRNCKGHTDLDQETKENRTGSGEEETDRQTKKKSR